MLIYIDIAVVNHEVHWAVYRRLHEECLEVQYPKPDVYRYIFASEEKRDRVMEEVRSVELGVNGCKHAL